jgi:NADH-quinone oxidoreductase subunit K
MIPIGHVVALSAILFTIGVVGALTRRNVIVVLMSIELMLNAANLALVAFNRAWGAATGALDGQVFALLVVAVAAAEVAVGLGVLLAVVRNRDTVNLDEVNLLRW